MAVVRPWLVLGLQKLCNGRFFDTDGLIEGWERMPISDIFQHKGEDYFRRLELSTLNNILEGDRGVIATGGGLPAISGAMAKLNQCSITIYLKASIDELWNRLTVDRKELDKRPLLLHRVHDALILGLE